MLFDTIDSKSWEDDKTKVALLMKVPKSRKNLLCAILAVQSAIIQMAELDNFMLDRVSVAHIIASMFCIFEDEAVYARVDKWASGQIMQRGFNALRVVTPEKYLKVFAFFTYVRQDLVRNNVISATFRERHSGYLSTLFAREGAITARNENINLEEL